jgi:hypothetical protein
MSEINVVSRTQHIVVDPIISDVDVVEVQYASGPQNELLLGNKLANSFSTTINTGNKVAADGEIAIWNFTLPATMKVGDHVRLRFLGSLGDMTTGQAGIGWFYRVYLNNVKITEVYPLFTPAGGYGSTPQRAPFIEDIDLMYQAINSAWIWHRHSQGWMKPPATASVATDGAFHTLAAYTNPAVNLANIPIKIAVQNGTATATNMIANSLTVEHLIAP